MNNWEQDYINLVGEVIDNGFIADSRAGLTYSLPFKTITIPLDEGFPLLTTRKMFPAGVFGELAGFVRGAEDLTTYEKFGCKYWRDNAAAWSFNQDLAVEDWQIGRSYGAIWRDFGGVDQLKQVIQQLKADPLSRRHVVSAWDPAAKAALPSCHILYQFYARNGELHCGVMMRSVDLCVGLPSDIILYALLTELIAKDTRLKPKSLTFFFGDCHVYANHIEQFRAKQACQAPLESPSLALSSTATTLLFTPAEATICNYESGPTISYTFNA